MSGIYIHFPFCKKRCIYCDFYLITNLRIKEKFLSGIKKEISLYSDTFKNEKFETISFGGGTPSLLSGIEISDLINFLYKNFHFSNNPEISLEANPEDYSEEKFIDYKKAGVNRLSFGIQSFIDSELKFLSRQHNSHEAEKVIKHASKYFDNINTDIIYSLPSQTQEDINYSLDKVIDLGINHISAYTLTYEERTLLFKKWKNNIVKKNPESIEAEMYGFVSGKLVSNGFIHYEVSNFAKKNYKSRHNLKYWNYENYLGLGPSAHSFFNNERWNNIRDIAKYNFDLEKDILPIENKNILEKHQIKLEFIMLSLRSQGISFEKYEFFFGKDFREEYRDSIDELLKNNFAEINKKYFRLNESGYTVADEIVARYF